MCHQRFIVPFLLFTIFGIGSANAKKAPSGGASAGAACIFPEARERPFFFDIPTDVPARSILVDTVVEPSDAKLTIANIRANNLEADVDLDTQLALEKRSSGQFLVITAASPPVVHFPDYPSTVNETLLYVTVRCNGRLYPLMTIRVRNVNMHSPEFLGLQPYEISIARNAPVGTLYETPVKALDLDPADQYPITFGIEPPFDRDFALVTAGIAGAADAADQPAGAGRSVAEEARLLATLPPAYSKRVEHWHQQQMPRGVQLKVLAKSLATTSGKSVYYLNVSASDNGQPEPRVSYAQLKVSVKEAREAAARFSSSEYFANFTKEMVPGADLPPNGEQPIVATFPAQRIGDRVRYELDLANPYAQLFELDPWTGRLRLAQRVPDGVPPTVELELTARLIPRDVTNGIAIGGPSDAQQQSVRTKITLTDQTEVRLTYFAQCHYDAHLAENPSAYTRVLQFIVRGDVQGVELLNGSDLFKVDSDGVMIVRPGVNIDRESTDRIIVKARLMSRSPLHPRSLELCQIATADIHIDDVNDHSPRFTRRSYRFRIDARPFNNTEVGPLRAVDGDKGEFGHVRYRLLEEFVPDGKGGEEPLPFVLFQADGAATIFYVVKPLHLELSGTSGQYQPQPDYTFTVEAYDSTEDPRTARVTVNVRLADLTEQEAEREREEAVRERQLDQQHHNQQFELQQDEPSTQAEEEEEEQDSAVDDRHQTRMAQRQRHSNNFDRDTDNNNRRAHAVATLALDGTGAKQPLQFGNKFGDQLPSDDDERQQQQQAVGLVRFSADKYTFRVRGPLAESQTIGMVHAKRMDGTDEIEFAVEEGIAGFVGVDANTGRLFVGPWLLRDRFEEIRFSVAAQHPSGQVLATALVSVLIDDLGPPEFTAPHYQFELDQAADTWPHLVGQVNAIPFTGNDQLRHQQNGTVGTSADLGNPSAMFFYALDDDQRPNDSNQQPQMISRWFEIDEQTGQISAISAPPIGIDQQRKTVKFRVKACLRANATICGRSSVEVVVFDSTSINAIAEEQSADFVIAVPPRRIEFIPLPRTVFLTTGKQPGSAILRVSVREFDPRDGVWRLLPLSSAAAGDSDKQRLRVAYSVASEGGGEQQGAEATVQKLFRMRDNVLTLVGRPVPGEYNLTIRATAAAQQQSPPPSPASTPEEWARRRAATIAARRHDASSSASIVQQHSLRVIVMRAEDGRERYPVFERISYEFVINAGDSGSRSPHDQRQRQRFPIAMRPPLNASLAGGRLPIRFTMFPARADDPPTDGIEIDEHSGQLWVHRRFVDAALNAAASANRSSGSSSDRGDHQSPPGTEAFIVVRATNRAHPEFYSDASVALLIRPDIDDDDDQAATQSMPEFDAPLYRIVVREDAPVGTVLNSGAPIALVEPTRHAKVQLQLRLLSAADQQVTASSSASSLIDHFQLMDNGMLVLIKQIDIEQMDDVSNGVIELEVVASVVDGDEHQHDDHSADQQQPAVQPSSHARVQVQVVDVDEFSPRFEPSSPEFHLQVPLISAGQLIGHLHAQDDDFSDRRPGSLVYRAILGNASELVHVKRDGTLLVKDPKSWQNNRPSKAEPNITLFLLVEARGNSGQTASTTVKFVIEVEKEENGTNENMDDDATNSLTTVDSRGTTMDFTAVPAFQHALFSVRDSLSPDQLALYRSGQLLFRLDEPTARKGMFRVDARTGELYMEASTAFNGMPTEETEHELGVEVVVEHQQQHQQVVARRTFTVRLVQRTTTATATMETVTRTSSSSTPTTTATPTAAEHDTDDTTATATEMPTTTTAATTTIETKETAPTTTTPSSNGRTTTLVEEQQQQKQSVDGGGDNDEEESTIFPDELDDEPFGTTTDILPALSAVPPNSSEARRAPTAAPLVPLSSSVAFSTPSSDSGGSLKFTLPRYHWIVSEPTKQSLIGRLEMRGDGQLLDSVVIEPPQFRTWFQLDQRSGELYLREVPDQLFGRQRAEFRAHLTAMDGHWADAVVVVDLNLPPKSGGVGTGAGVGGDDESVPKSATIGHKKLHHQQQLATPSGIEIAESSDKASRTAAPTETKIGSLKPVAAAAAASSPRSTPVTSSRSTFATRRKTTTTVSSSTVSTSAQPNRYSSTMSTATTTTVATVFPSTAPFTTSSSSTRSPSADHSNAKSTTTTDQSDQSPAAADQSLSSSSSRSPVVGVDQQQQQNELHFASDQYRAMLPEGRYGNSGALLSLRPQPLAHGMPGGVEFSIITASSDQPQQQQQLPFFVRRDTGELIAFSEIDREEQAQYQFRVMAFDPAQNRSAEAHVTVHILDVNDNFPQFVEPLPRVIALGRLSPPGTLLARFSAVDMDDGAHGTVRFLIGSVAAAAVDRADSDQQENNEHDDTGAGADGHRLFSMEPDGRLMFHGLPSPLAVEQHHQDGAVQQQQLQQDIYALRILAIDGGRPALRTEHKLRIELFTEGQPPAFKQADFVADRVPAGAAQNGTFVAQVVAGTSDQIEYSLIDPPTANLFLIDSHTGQIRMGRRPLDSERGREWVLNVLAVEGHGDRASSARTTVHVFLESFRPETVDEIGPDKLLLSPSSSTSATIKIVGEGIVPTSTGECRFEERVFYSEIAENTEGRQRLVTLGTTGGCAGHKLRFTLQQNNDAFVLDEQSGDLYAVQPLDRERKSLYFLVANLLVVNNNNNNNGINNDDHHPHPALSSAAVPVGLATVREIQLELHPTEQHHQQAPASSTASDGTIEDEDEEEESAGGATNAKNRKNRKSRQTQQQQQKQGSKTKSNKELFNGVVEQAKAKLTANQALVLVHVLDRNDNLPQIEHLNVDGQIVFTVDWQLPVMGQVGRVGARDADEHAKLLYRLEQQQQQNANAAPMFAINETTGVITLIRSFQNDDGTSAGDEFCMNVLVNDGQHVAKAPLLIYKLQPGTNIVLLVINQPADQVDVLHAVRHMNALLPGMDADVLVKQVFIGEDGQADPRRTHLLVYAVDSRTRVPVPAAKLKELLDGAFGAAAAGGRSASSTPPAGAETVAADSPLRYLASIYVPEDYTGAMEHNNSTFRLTTAEITLLAISVLLVFGVCAMLFTLLRCCKNKQQQTITKSDVEYMLDAQQAGPRPYNVELITRKMAQSDAAAVARRMPKALEQCTLSPESRATMVASAGIYSGGSVGGDGSAGARTAATTMPSGTAAAASGQQRRGGGGAGQHTDTATEARTVVGSHHPVADSSTTTTTTTTTTTSANSDCSSEEAGDRNGSGGEFSPQQQQSQQQQQKRTGGSGEDSRSELQLHHNLLLVRRRNSRGGNGGGARAADKQKQQQQQPQKRRVVQPITYESYADVEAGIYDDRNTGAGGTAAAVPTRNGGSSGAIDDNRTGGDPMQDTMCSSVEHSPQQMARASANGGGGDGGGRVAMLAATLADERGDSGPASVGSGIGRGRRGAPPRHDPPPPPGANAPPATNIAGQRQQQAATIIGTKTRRGRDQ
ncbi:hypothetical protein niasHT_037852 [Heterodera trifolii]|uniref:Cadherin domain-containing protein n=1 Tax=Heterodera trifolii TaxID=157864 RepID=A0ABD2IQA6_9BILA